MSWWVPIATTAAQMGFQNFMAGQARDEARTQAKENTAAQKEFAQHGVSWRVADARRAGIDPLAAMGASTHQYQSQVGAQTDTSAPDLSGIERAFDKKKTSHEDALTAEAHDRLLTAQVRKAEADANHAELLNQKLTSDLITKDGTRRPQPNTVEKLINKAGAIEGTFPDIAFSDTSHGGLSMTASDDFAKRTEDDPVRKTIHWLRNLIMPPSHGASSIDTKRAPDGYHYERTFYGDYVLVPNSTRHLQKKSKWRNTGETVRPSGSYLNYKKYDYKDYYR